MGEMFGLAPDQAEDALIGVATGMVMERRACTAAEARTLLCDAAQSNHVTICDLAEQVIVDRDLR